jgi:hypothetical protein
MDERQWARWMSLLEQGERPFQPARTVSAYVLQDDPNWTEEECQAKLDELRKVFLEDPPNKSGNWVVFERLDGTHEVIWP